MRLKNKALHPLILLVGIVFFINGCNHSSNEIQFNAFLPQTGELSFLGEPGKIALQIAEKKINSDGGILGDSLKVVFHDTKGNPSTVRILFERLPKETKSRTILSTLSGVSLEAAKLTSEIKEPILQFVLAIHPDIVSEDYKNVRVCYNAKDEASLIVKALKDEGIKDIVSLISIDAVSTLEYNSYIKPELDKLGINNLGIESFNIGQSDFKVIANRVAKLKPEAIILLGYGSDFVAIMESIKSQESLLNTKIIGGIGFIEVPSYVDTREYRNVIFTAPKILLEDSSSWKPDFKEFVKEYKKHDSNVIIPPYDAIYTYESIMLWYTAIKELKNAGEKDATNPANILSYIRSLKKYDGISGTINLINGDSYPIIELASFSNEVDDKMLILK